MSAPFVKHEHGAWCHPAADGCHEWIPAPPLTADERAIVARFDAAEPAPESYVRQHRMTSECWCGPTLAPGTKFGVLMHRKVDEVRIGELFSGYGGLGAGVQSVLGGDVAWHSEIDQGACKILAHRYPKVPNLGDITRIDWASVEPVDVLTGGSPCQDLSHAGKRGGMTEGTRSNLWVSMRDAIAALRPPLVVWENVRGAFSACADSEMGSCPGCVGDGPHRPVLRALGRVLGDLSSLGYDASWQGLRASDVGAPHGRFRVFVIAWPVADATDERSDRPRSPRIGRNGPANGDLPAANTEGQRRGEGGPEPTRVIGGSDDAFRSTSTPADAHRAGREACRGRSGAWDARRREPVVSGSAAWGRYADAIQRWERVTGRPAPGPTELTAKGTARLSARAVEWMMGLPVGWVTDVPGLTRNEQLKALGNGVVPQQAAEALRLLLPDIEAMAA